MKRLLFLLLLLLFISTIAIYFFISSPLKVVAVTVVPTNAQAAFRLISDPKKWANWVHQPGTTEGKIYTDRSFLFNSDTFLVREILHNAVRLSVSGDLPVNSLFSIVPVSKDTTALRWEAELQTGINPITKLRRYRQASELKNNLSALLKNLSTYLSNPEHLYGSNFTVTSTDDTLLVAKKMVLSSYPQTADIYKIIGELQQVVLAQGSRQTAPAMMNVSPTNDSAYLVMVALPIDKKVTVTEPYLYRKLVKGNFLTAEVKGGNYTVDQTLSMMRLYISEYGKTAMAIPFQMLVSDRLKETDSSKWVTKIYYPVVR